MVVMQVLGEDEVGKEAAGHVHSEDAGITPTKPNKDGSTDYDDDPTTVPFDISGSKKIMTVANDVNKAKSQENQNKTVVTINNKTKTINIKTNVNELNSYTSTNPAQGEGKWIGLDIDTGENSIIGVKYNGAELTQADVDEAASIGIGAGHFVYWIKAESEFPKTFTLSKEGKEETEVKITLNK